MLVVDLATQYGRSTPMICTALKKNESIKDIKLIKVVTIIFSRKYFNA